MADVKKATIGGNYSDFELGKSTYMVLYNTTVGFKYAISSSVTSGTLVEYEQTKIQNTAIYITLPLTLANEYPNSTSFSVTFYVKTYDADGNYVGLSSASSRTCTIPASVVPSISAYVSDALGYADSYGGYLQALSKVSVDISASGAYGSTIKSISTTIDGNTYTGAEVESNILKNSGVIVVSSAVTDSRGRETTETHEITVLPYTPPRVNSLSIVRTDQNGNAQKNGGYLTVTFGATVTAIDGKNSAEYSVKYKKVSQDTFTEEELTALSGVYSVTDQTFTFPASAESSWNVSVVAVDDFKTVTRAIVGASAARLFSVLARGLGFAFGKTADLADTLEIAFKTKFTGGITPNELLSGANLDEIKTVCSYSGLDASTAAYVNCPISSGVFALEVLGAGSGRLFQRLTCRFGVYLRYGDGVSWGAWVQIASIDTPETIIGDAVLGRAVL